VVVCDPDGAVLGIDGQALRMIRDRDLRSDLQRRPVDPVDEVGVVVIEPEPLLVDREAPILVRGVDGHRGADRCGGRIEASGLA
jgi:hypothetical protein